MSARKQVEDVLGGAMTRAVWSNDYQHAVPVSVQDFDLSAVLPAVFYMFRFGRRRGKGEFVNEFGHASGSPAQRRRSVTVDRIVDKLSRRSPDDFGGLENEASKAILGDLLLCYCLDNARNALGRDKQVQRVAPAHYMSSWIDLPEWVANLRHVPETIVALLANQSGSGQVRWTRQEERPGSSFPVGGDIRYNVIARPFSKGMSLKGGLTDNLAADRFDEDAASVGIDELLMIRLAQRMRSAPQRTKTKPEIPNRRSIAARSARLFSADLRSYLIAYADHVPRQFLVEALESCLAVGLTSMLSSAVHIMEEWGQSGRIDGERRPCDIFVDCSAGADRKLRALAEQSMDEFMRRARRLLVHFMALRLLDYSVGNNIKMKREFRVGELKDAPNATEWLTLLGDVVHGRHERSGDVMHRLVYLPDDLASHMEDDYPDVAGTLADDEAIRNPVFRLAEGLVALQGSKAQSHLANLTESALMIDRPNGLARKRRAQRTIAGARKTVVLRSVAFTDTALEYLVHLLLLEPGDEPSARPWFSFNDFIGSVRDRYGFCVDRSPEGMDIPNELLQQNRAFLDRRLRDLGLLISVNDAEAMKRLAPRFEPSKG